MIELRDLSLTELKSLFQLIEWTQIYYSGTAVKNQDKLKKLEEKRLKVLHEIEVRINNIKL